MYSSDELQKFLDQHRDPSEQMINLLSLIYGTLLEIKDILRGQNAHQSPRGNEEPGDQAKHWHQTEATGDEDTRINNDPEPASHRHADDRPRDTGSTKRDVRGRRSK